MSDADISKADCGHRLKRPIHRYHVLPLRCCVPETHLVHPRVILILYTSGQVPEASEKVDEVEGSAQDFGQTKEIWVCLEELNYIHKDLVVLNQTQQFKHA